MTWALRNVSFIQECNQLSEVPYYKEICAVQIATATCYLQAFANGEPERDCNQTTTVWRQVASCAIPLT